MSAWTPDLGQGRGLFHFGGMPIDLPVCCPSRANIHPEVLASLMREFFFGVDLPGESESEPGGDDEAAEEVTPM